MSIETFLLHPPVTQVFMIHGYHSSPHKKWFQWLNLQGIMKNIKFKAIELPDPDNPDPEKWRETIALEIGVVTKQIGIVGHSLGCQAALQYLDSLSDDQWKLGRMVLVSGFNVYPNEVEDVIAAMPGVAEVAAVGVPDKIYGEEVICYVVPKDKALTEAAVLEHSRKFLPPAKMPKQVLIVADLPKSDRGKVLRDKLREDWVAKQKVSA